VCSVRVVDKDQAAKGVSPSEARRAENWAQIYGVGLLGTGQLDPLHLAAKGPGERCKLIQRGQGQSPGRSTIFLYSEVSKLRYFG